MPLLAQENRDNKGRKKGHSLPNGQSINNPRSDQIKSDKNTDKSDEGFESGSGTGSDDLPSRTSIQYTNVPNNEKVREFIFIEYDK